MVKIMLSRMATAAMACVAMALSSSQSVVRAEDLCSITPSSYTSAKTTYPGLVSALTTLEEYSIAAWYTDRLSTDDRSTMLSSLTSECSEDSRMTIVVYGIPNKDCDAGLSSGGSVQSTSDYQTFLQELTDAVGDRKVLYVVEPDAVGLLANDGCGSSAGYLDNLKVAVAALSANANAQLYVDVGYWLLADETNAADVATIIGELSGSGTLKGVTINTSNYRSTDEVAGYCTSFQTAMGSEDMTCIIDTSRNYNGSPTSDWCNVKTAGIGKPPTSETGVSNLDYFMWLKPPGESDGVCSGSYASDSLTGTTAGTFYDEGFQMLWDQGYFVSEQGMATISGSSNTSSQTSSQTSNQAQDTPTATSAAGSSSQIDVAGTVVPADSSASQAATTVPTSTTATPTATTATPTASSATPTATTYTPTSTTTTPIATTASPTATTATPVSSSSQTSAACKAKKRLRKL